jgi:hypothetical protein
MTSSASRRLIFESVGEIGEVADLLPFRKA